MVHGDDKGLVLPPYVAGIQAVLSLRLETIQVVIVPVGIKATSSEEERTTLAKERSRGLP